MTRLIIVDADGRFRNLLRKATHTANDIEVVAETGDAREALNLLSVPAGSILFFGVESLQQDHLSFLKQVVQVSPKTGVILAARSADDQAVVDAFRIGLRGFVKKSEANVAEIVQMIRTIGRGGSVLTPHLTALIVDEFLCLAARTDAASRAGK